MLVRLVSANAVDPSPLASPHLFSSSLTHLSVNEYRSRAVALALDPQILPSGDKVPTTPNDFRLDGVVSPQGVVWREGVQPEQLVRSEK